MGRGEGVVLTVDWNNEKNQTKWTRQRKINKYLRLYIGWRMKKKKMEKKRKKKITITGLDYWTTFQNFTVTCKENYFPFFQSLQTCIHHKYNAT